MITLLLFAILVVLILGFWGEAGFGFLLLLGIGALSIVAIIVVLVLLGISIGSIVVVWNTTVVPFWNANKALIEPPLSAVIIIPLWIYCAIKVWVYVRQKVASFSLSNDTTFEKFMFFVVGGPTLFEVSGFTLALFAIPIVHLVRVMKMWLVVISAT